MYTVYRRIYDGKPENSGNRENDSTWNTREAAEVRCKMLNEADEAAVESVEEEFERERRQDG